MRGRVRCPSTAICEPVLDEPYITSLGHFWDGDGARNGWAALHIYRTQHREEDAVFPCRSDEPGGGSDEGGGKGTQAGQGTLDKEAAVEVLNRILHMELSGVMQHFHHRWVSRWLRASRPRAVAIGQHIASLRVGRP